MGTGDIVEQGPQIITAFEALEKVIAQMDSTIDAAEKEVSPEQAAPEEDALVDVLPGFPEKVEGEILFLDADNISTDGIYPGMYASMLLCSDYCSQNVQKDADLSACRQVHLSR